MEIRGRPESHAIAGVSTEPPVHANRVHLGSAYGLALTAALESLCMTV